MNSRQLLLETICAAWNSGNADLMENILHEEMEYSSYWVYNTIKGKDSYLQYLREKYIAIKTSGKRIKAQLCYLKGELQVCLWQNNEPVYLYIEIENDLISSMYLMPF